MEQLKNNKISVVLPVFNEAAALPTLLVGIQEACTKAGLMFEIVAVNDGSRDNTAAVLADLMRTCPELLVVELARNYGQTAALAAGIDNATGSIIVTLDADLQHDPRLIPTFVAELQQGYDIVSGWRATRTDSALLRRLPSAVANRLMRWRSGVDMRDFGSTFKAYRAEVIQGIELFGEMHRFIPALADEIGAKIAEIPVNHRERRFGTSKYGLSRTIRVVLDLITVKFLLGYSKRPIHLFGSIGMVSGLLGGFILTFLTYQRFFMHIPMGNRPMLALGIMLIIIGLQFLVFGLLAEVLARTYYESQNKSIYVVRRIFEAGNKPSPEPGVEVSRFGRKFASL